MIHTHRSTMLLPNLSSIEALVPSQIIVRQTYYIVLYCIKIKITNKLTVHFSIPPVNPESAVFRTSIQNFSQIGIQMNLPRSLEVAATYQLNLPDLSCCFCCLCRKQSSPPQGHNSNRSNVGFVRFTWHILL